MKKWMKGFVIAGVAMVCIGIGMTALAGAVGGTRLASSDHRSVRRLMNRVMMLPGLRGLQDLDGFYWQDDYYDIDYDYSYDYELDAAGGYDYNAEFPSEDFSHHDNGQGHDHNTWDSGDRSSHIEKSEMTAVATYEGVKNLELKARFARMHVVENPELDNQIVIYLKDGPGHGVRHEQKSSSKSLEIEFYSKKNYAFAEGIVEIPSGYRFDKASVQAEASEVQVDYIAADKLELDSEASGLCVADFDAGILEADAGAGALEAAGNVSEKLEADVEAGELRLCLTGDQKDFNYNIESSAGTVKVGSEIYSGLHFENDMDNDADKTAGLSAAAGSLELYFKAE